MPLFSRTRGRVEIGAEEARQLRRDAALKFMQLPPALPSPRMCPVRPRVRELWRVQRHSCRQGITGISWQQVQCAGLGCLNDSPQLRLPSSAGHARARVLYDAGAVYRKGIKLLGPGSLADGLLDAAAWVEQQAMADAEPLIKDKRYKLLHALPQHSDGGAGGSCRARGEERSQCTVSKSACFQNCVACKQCGAARQCHGCCKFALSWDRWTKNRLL